MHFSPTREKKKHYYYSLNYLKHTTAYASNSEINKVGKCMMLTINIFINKTKCRENPIINFMNREKNRRRSYSEYSWSCIHTHTHT